MKNEADKTVSASDWQGSDKYAGIDSYEKIELKPGTQLCSLVFNWSNDNPRACEYLFPKDLLDKVDNDSIILNEGLQIAPYRNLENDVCSYKKEVAMFEVQKPIEVETGLTAENTAYGKGGMTQFYIPNEKFMECLSNGSLIVVSLGNSNDALQLKNNMISRSEYDYLIERNNQLNLRRNLFCHQKAKLDTLEIIQSSPNLDDVKKAEENYKTLNQDIANIYEDLRSSIKRIGKVLSPLYDSLNKQLSSELAYRESHPNNLMLSNVVVKKAETETTEVVFDRSNMNVVVETGKSKTEEIGENLFKKIDSYKEGSDGNPIDVKRQGLWDVMNINRINQESREMMQTTALRQRDYSQVQTLAFQGRDGTFKECKLSDYFTEASVAKIQNTRNGQLTGMLEMKDGTKAKLYIEGNKAQLYLPQKEEVLVKQVDKLPMDHSQKKALLAGSCMMGMRIDRELNAIVRGNSAPQAPPAKVCHVKRTVSRGIS